MEAAVGAGRMPQSDIGAPNDNSGYLMVDGTVTIFKEGKDGGQIVR